MKKNFDTNYKSFIGVTPLILFILILIITGITTKSFTSMPVLVAFMIVAAYTLCLNRKDEKISLEKKVEIFAKGAGNSTIILMVLIFILAGAFSSVANSMGAVDSTVSFGLSILPQNWVLPGLFLVSCIISFSMGTSMGTITALTPIAAGLFTQTDISLPLLIGTVVGGAMFGDNLSFVSDTTIAASRTQNIELKEKFKINSLMVLPAVIITLLILTFSHSSNSDIIHSEYSLIRILPYLCIIISALIGLNVIAVLGIGIGVGSILGLYLNSFTFLELLGIIQKGFSGMQDLALISIVVAGVISLMEYHGGINYLLDKVTKNIKTKKGAEASIATLASLLDIAAANNTIAIVTAGPLAKDISTQYSIDPRRTASLLDIFSSAFQGLIPYTPQLLLAAGIANQILLETGTTPISPMQIISFNYYSMLMIGVGSLSIITGIPKLKQKISK